MPRFQDNDFKWVYDLLEPPQGKWRDWLAAANEPLLPAPRSVNYDTTIAADPSETPTIPTCDSAWWSGPVVR